MNKAVFIDKDGTLIKDIPYNVDPELDEIYDGAPESLRALQDLGYLLIIISNQSGVAHGYFHEGDLKQVEARIHSEMLDHGVQLSAFYFCPHHPKGKVKNYAIECECRKPRPGMLLKAADHFKIDLNRSWMIGDILNDVEAGNSAGCKTILINNGNETEWCMNEIRTPAKMVNDINAATRFILENQHEHAVTTH
jgi:D-glycero-D-manno-heptose 1,7-bisphosphate phosphatase